MYINAGRRPFAAAGRLINLTVAVVVSIITDLQPPLAEDTGILTAILIVTVQIIVIREAGAQQAEAPCAGRARPSQDAGSLTGAAMSHICLKVKALIQLTITVIILAITALRAIRSAIIFTAILDLSIQVVVTRLAGLKLAAPLATPALGVGQNTGLPTGAAVGHVGLEIKALVQLIIAVIVDAITELNPFITGDTVVLNQERWAALSDLPFSVLHPNQGLQMSMIDRETGDGS